MIGNKPYRIVWHIPRKVFAIERRGALVGICWAWSLDDYHQPGDVVLLSQETFDALATATPEQELPAAA